MSKKVRFQVIHDLRKNYRLCWLLDIAEVSRQGYCKWAKQLRGSHTRKRQDDEELKEHIVAIHKLRPFYGYQRMTVALRLEGFHINHKRTYRLMKELSIQSVIRRKRKFFGTQASVVHPNRLSRNFRSEAPNKKWATDITYLPVGGGFNYLSVIQDLYDNQIVAYQISERNDLKLVFDTIELASKKVDVTGIIIHSDQGFQYTSTSYNKRLEQLGMFGSHSRKGNCLDNACIESFFSHLKSEMLYISEYSSVEDLYQAIDDYIQFYNNVRFQKRLGHLSPVQYRLKMAA